MVGSKQDDSTADLDRLFSRSDGDETAIRTPARGLEVSSHLQRELPSTHEMSVERANPGFVATLDAFFIQGELPDRKRRKVAGCEVICWLSGLQGTLLFSPPRRAPVCAA